MAPITDPELRRRMTTARREIRKAVERWGTAESQGVDFRRGHRVEAARRAREVRDEADRLIRTLEGSS